MALECPHCQGTKSDVINSRSNEGFGIMRRRECSNCQQRYTTREMTELDLATIRQEAMGVGFNLQTEIALLASRCSKILAILAKGETGAQKKDV